MTTMSADHPPGAKIHPSHQMELDWDYPDPHNPGIRCTTCNESACSMCELDGDDDLAMACAGFSWLHAITVTGDDGIQRRVRKSGIGWPLETGRMA
jgi:hypothetical protein